MNAEVLWQHNWEPEDRVLVAEYVGLVSDAAIAAPANPEAWSARDAAHYGWVAFTVGFLVGRGMRPPEALRLATRMAEVGIV